MNIRKVASPHVQVCFANRTNQGNLTLLFRKNLRFFRNNEKNGSRQIRLEPLLLRKYKKLHRKYLHLLKNMVIQCQVEFPLN